MPSFSQLDFNMKKILVILMAYWITGGSIMGQSNAKSDETFPWSHQKEIGLNFTPLISQLVPFNLGDTRAGFSSFSYKRYGRKFGLRINAGIEFDDEFTDEGFALLTLGFERRRQVSKKITFTNGLDTGLFGFFDDDPFFNISAFYGFEYNFSPKFFAAAEGNIQLLFGNGARIQVNPPIAVFFFVRID